MSADELLPLPGTDWHVWSSVVVRGPGFPAYGLDRFTAPDCAAAVDAYLTVERRGRWADRRRTADGDRLTGSDEATLFAAARDAYLAAAAATTAAAATIAADPLVREAVTWQSPTSVEALDGLVRRGPTADRTVRQHGREIVLARYWQRYCGKNDTIGFFGPVGWARFAATGPALTVKPGPDLVRDRVVDLEWRPVAALAARLSADPVLRPHLPVIRAPQVSVHSGHIWRPGAPPTPVAAPVAALLAQCDGTRTAAQLCAQAAAEPSSGLRRPEDAALVLEQLAAQGHVHWGLDVPLRVDAAHRLRTRLVTLADTAGPAGAAALADLDRLLTARAALAAAAGDADRVRVALAALEADVEAVTDGPARHRAGETYAGRGVAYEETARDVELEFGPAVLELLGPALGVVLRAARWLTATIATEYTTALREQYDEATAAERGRPIPVGELAYLVNGVMHSSRLATTVGADLRRRWTELLNLSDVDTDRVQRSSADLAVEAAFPADAPGWRLARLHSPDVHLCAASVDALNRGEASAVLGELHVAWLTIDADVFVRFHPDPDALAAAVRRDLGDRVVLLYPPDYPDFTARMAPALTGPGDVTLAYADAPVSTLDGVLPLAGLTATLVDDVLVATAPDGRTWPLVELFGPFLSALAANAFTLAGTGAHTPRVTIDRLVVQRETWRTTVAATGLLDPPVRPDRDLRQGVAQDLSGFLAVRRWRRALGLPERVFIRVGTETKPCYVDFTSPFYTKAFVSMVRTAARTGGDAVSLSVSELLPGPEQAWLPDGDGQRYLSELRLTLRDPVPGASR